MLAVVVLPEVEFPAPERRLANVTIHPLVLKIPERMYFTQATPVPERKVRPRPVRRGNPALPAPPAVQTNRPAGEVSWLNTPDLPAPPVKPPPRRFELPVERNVARPEQTILRPEVPIKVEPVPTTPAPPLIIWSQTLPAPRRPEPRKFVMPGRKEIDQPAPTLDAAPSVMMPNREVSSADLSIAAQLNQSASLPKPQASARPVRFFKPPEPKKAAVATVSDQAGEPVNLVSIPAAAVKWTDTVQAPAFAQVGAILPPPSGAGAEARDTGKAGGKEPPDDAEAARARSRARSGEGDARRGASKGAPILLDPARRALTADKYIRTVHPNNQVFDIVIQSSAADVLPESVGILSGKPVYTVYLPMGKSKTWILQYCIPGSTTARKEPNGFVVRLENPSTVKAPFPLVTYSLIAAVRSTGRYALIHGYVTITGSFENLEVVRGGTPETNADLITGLGGWEFRPATQGGQPVRVEILLAIPAELVNPG